MQSHFVYTDHNQFITASAGAIYQFCGRMATAAEAFGDNGLSPCGIKLSADMIYGSGLRDGDANIGTVPAYTQVNVGIKREFLLPNDPKPMTIRFDVVNLFDSIYEIRDGSGIGVFAPQSVRDVVSSSAFRRRYESSAGAVLVMMKVALLCSPPSAREARGGEGSGVGGLSTRSTFDGEFAETPPTPDPSPPLRGGRGEKEALMRRWLHLLSILAVLAYASAVQAHPHVWVTASSELIFSADGSVTGVRHAWTFDDMFSTYALQGITTKRKGVYSREELAPLAQTNVESLKEFCFLHVCQSGQQKAEVCRSDRLLSRIQECHAGAALYASAENADQDQATCAGNLRPELFRRFFATEKRPRSGWSMRPPPAPSPSSARATVRPPP